MEAVISNGQWFILPDQRNLPNGRISHTILKPILPLDYTRTLAIFAQDHHHGFSFSQ